MATNKPNPKKALSKKNFMQEMHAWRDELKKQAQGWLAQLGQFRNIEQNNYELGHRHLALGNITDAIFRFKFVTWMNPNRADAWYYLGCSYLANKNKKLAKPALEKAVALKPDYEEAVYMAAMLGGAHKPQKMPLTLSREYFDSQAATFAHDETETKGYEGHTILCNAVRSQLTPGRIDYVMLELGVGTGLSGPLLRDAASHITGVDISQPMLAEAMNLQDAQGKKIYDALIHRDAESFLAEAPADGYDIVMAANLFSFIGGLQGLFQYVSPVMKPGGLLAFTADKMDGEGYDFDAATGRFQFSLPYLEKLAAASGLKPIKCTQANIYPDYPAWLCLFKK